MITYQRLREYVRQHGNVSIVDTQGRTRKFPGDWPDIDELLVNADRFLWDGLTRSRQEMEDLISQSERGQQPGCRECDRLEKGLIAARDRDRKQENLDGKHEMPALREFQDHRLTHRRSVSGRK